MKKYKFELISLLVIGFFSLIYYFDTGEVKVVGLLLLALIVFNVGIHLSQKLIKKFRDYNHT